MIVYKYIISTAYYISCCKHTNFFLPSLNVLLFYHALSLEILCSYFLIQIKYI